MNKFIMLATIILVPTLANAISLNPLPPLYGQIFGNENASALNQRKAQQALKDYGYSGTVRVRKMNQIGSRLIGMQLYSFTLLADIWLDEALLDTLDEPIRTWLIYHEVAHVVHNHHAKALAFGGIIVACTLAEFYAADSLFHNQWIASAIAGLSGSYLLHSGIQRFVRLQEKAADIAAVKILCKNNKKHIIEAYLDHLSSLINEGHCNENDGWHYKLAEQFDYLQYELNASGL